MMRARTPAFLSVHPSSFSLITNVLVPRVVMRNKAVFLIFPFGFQLLLCSPELSNELSLTKEALEGSGPTGSTRDLSVEHSESAPRPSGEEGDLSAHNQPNIQSPRVATSDDYPAGGPPKLSLFQLIQLERRRQRAQAAGAHHTHFQHHPQLPSNTPALQRTSSFASQQPQSPAPRTWSEGASPSYFLQLSPPMSTQSYEQYNKAPSPQVALSGSALAAMDSAPAFHERGHQNVNAAVDSGNRDLASLASLSNRGENSNRLGEASSEEGVQKSSRSSGPSETSSTGSKRAGSFHLSPPSSKYRRPSDPGSEGQSPIGLASQLERLNSERAWREYNRYLTEGEATGTGTSSIRGGEEARDLLQKVYSSGVQNISKVFDAQVSQQGSSPTKPAQPVFFPEEALETFASIAVREAEMDKHHEYKASVHVRDVLDHFFDAQILEKDLDKWKFFRRIEGSPAGLYQKICPADGKIAVLMLRNDVPCKNADVLAKLGLIFKQLWNLNSGVLDFLGIEHQEGSQVFHTFQRKILFWVQRQLLAPDESLPVVGYLKTQVKLDQLRFGQLQSQVANFLMIPQTPEVFTVYRAWDPRGDFNHVWLSRQEAEAMRLAVCILGSYYKTCDKPKWAHLFKYEIGFLEFFKARSGLDRPKSTG